MNNPQSIGVHVKCLDLDKSLKFYLDFGFKPMFAYGSDKWRKLFNDIDTVSEKYNGVTFGVGNALLELADGHIAVEPNVFKETVASSKMSLFVDVEFVGKTKKIAVSNKYEIIKDITTYPWGMDEVVIRDPDGVVVVFRSRVKV